MHNKDLIEELQLHTQELRFNTQAISKFTEAIMQFTTALYKLIQEEQDIESPGYLDGTPFDGE